MGGKDMNPSTARHEASHAAACVLLARPVEFVERTPGHGFAGEEVGKCLAPIPGEIRGRELVVALAGYWSEETSNWPPTYEEACTESREAVATIVRVLGVTEEIYADLVQATRELLADPEFIRLRDAIARALTVVPRLEREDVEALCRATNIPIPEEETTTCST